MRLPVLGLRSQLLLTLSAVFALSAGLLLFATLGLSQRQQQVTRRTQVRHWTAYLTSIAPAGEPSPTGELSWESLRVALTRLHTQGVIEAAQLDTHHPISIGRPQGNATIAGHLPSGQAFSLWLAPSMVAGKPALPRLLSFYLLVTCACALVLAYGLLTHTLVRPLALATAQAERLAQGQLQHRLPLRGTAEVVRLCRAFNAMAKELELERDSLRSRVLELEEKTNALREAQQQVVHSEKLASVGRLSAGIAHEIGNPLAAILGLLDLLRTGDLPPAMQAEFLERVERETVRIHHIIGGLLDYARKGPTNISRTRVALAPLIADTLTLVRSQRAARAVRFQVNVANEAAYVLASEAALGQVLLNLLLNALDALQELPGGQGEIVIHSRANGPWVEVYVEDNGPGLCPKIAQQVFDPFVTTKPPGQGTGLGLAVSAALCVQMGGRINGDNRSSGGARFRIELEHA